jgi:heme exporter protein C
MFVHVPTAWMAYLGFGVTFLASVAYLVKRSQRWDVLAVSSAEVGVLFTGLALVTGMIWGKPIWGVWWTWDARLVTTAIMFFVYLGYLALRNGILDPVLRAQRSAIFGIIAAVQIPIVHFSVVWWRTLHQPPSVLRPNGTSLDTPFFGALLAGVFAFTVLYVALLQRRQQLIRLRSEVARV